MNKVARKLILSVSACAMTLVTLTSTTYAWFARNNDAWTDEFTLEIEQHDGLVISIDGVNYVNSITNDNLFKAVAAKRLNKSVNEITNEEILEAKKTILAPVSTSNLLNFTTVNLNSTIENGYYMPQQAAIDSYLSFDLYFKIDQSKLDNQKNYYLTFVDQLSVDAQDDSKTNIGSYVKGTDNTIKLHNELIVPSYKADTLHSDGIYHSNEVITVNTRDSIRIGVLGDNTYIYEPYMGYGSYALDGDLSSYNLDENQLSLYNPNQNAMLTYFNNTHVEKLKPLDNQEDFNTYINTKKDFNGLDNLGVFTKTEDSYNPVKITVFIWLEGYDSDFIRGVDNPKISCYLNFMKKEVTEDEIA